MISAPNRRGFFIAAAAVLVTVALSAAQASAGVGRPDYRPFVIGAANSFAPKYFTVDLRDGVTPRDTAMVAAYFRSFGLRVTVDDRSGVLFVSGTHAQAAAAGHVSFELASRNGEQFVLADRPESFPPAIGARILATTINDGGLAIGGGYAQAVRISPNYIGVADPDGYSPTDIQQYYDFGSIETTGNEGSGQAVATILCGGVSTADVAGFETRFGLPSNAATLVNVDGGATSEIFQATTQVERIIGTAYKVTLTAYVLPNNCTFANVADAVAKVLSDDPTKKYHALVVGYGSYEDVYAADGATADMTAEDTDFSKLATDKTTTFAVTGDAGAFSDLQFFDTGVFFPGSDPNVVSLGTTVALAKSASNPTRLAEYASYDTGGGASTVFAIPTWQKGVAGMLSTTKRNVPDVALDGDCGTLYAGTFDGDFYIVCGSIYAADTWAGMLMLVDSARKTAGKTNLSGVPQTLYTERTVSGFYTDVTVGCNGFYCAAAGWDPVTGLGVPNASKVYSTLVGLP